MIVERDILDTIKPFLKRQEYLAVVGPRQAGKTTFLEIIKSCLIKERKVKPEAIHIVTFEDRKLLRQFETDPVSFARSYLSSEQNTITYLMMDEFQYSDEGGQKLKFIYDTIKNLKIIITGSSSLEIKAQIGKYMVGRILTFFLYPFNFGELLRIKDVRLEKIYREKQDMAKEWLLNGKKIKVKHGQDTFYEEMIYYFEQYCIWGGYPAVVFSDTDKERYKVLGDIYNSYILKDIKGLLELATEKELFLLSQYLSTQIGNIVVYQNISQAANLDYRQLKKHLKILKETFIFKDIVPYFKNRQKELSKNPKIYFMDIGFRNFLMENMNTLEKRSDSGAIVENIIFIRTNALCENIYKINFWRTKAGAEVDFVLHLKGEVVPLEVKFSNYEKPKITKSLASFIDTFKPARGMVLTKNYWGIIKKDNTQILFTPVCYL
ncbi:MAG: ATP-binding protein [Candidatus Omnitrophota bacterium]